jgi:hypothetical protein
MTPDLHLGQNFLHEFPHVLPLLLQPNGFTQNDLRDTKLVAQGIQKPGVGLDKHTVAYLFSTTGKSECF